MAGKAGSVLSQSDVEDMLSYDQAGLARPDTYDDVVFDATAITGAVYRYKTDAEKKDGDAVAAESVRASDDLRKRSERLRAKAGDAVPVADTVRVPAARG